MTIKYPKGTKVKCLQSSQGGGYTKGKVYTLRADFHESDDQYASMLTEFDDHGSTNNGWGQSFFRVVNEAKKSKKPAALQTQIGGSHYTDMVIQPATYNLANGLGWAEGDAVSYISRWRKKGGLQDLRKARQTLLLLIESEEAKGTA